MGLVIPEALVGKECFCQEEFQEVWEGH